MYINAFIKQQQLAITATKKSTHDARFSAATRVLEQLKAGKLVFSTSAFKYNFVITGVESLFNKANCDSAAITELLGGHAGVTDNNILQYMGIIEQRCNELLRLQSFIQAKVRIITLMLHITYMDNAGI